MSSPTQENRLVSITTPLGPDVLLVRRCTVREELSRLFEIDLELYSTKRDIEFDDIIAQNVTLKVERPDGGDRFFNGHVSRFIQLTAERGFSRYRATVVPWLWFLTRSSDCKIFQQCMEEPPEAMTVPGIIKKVFKDLGFEDFRDDGLSETYRQWEFCVQYRETAFNFVSRLMEQEGITYYFEHEDGKHTLVLADSINAHQPLPGYESVRYHPLSQGSADKEAVTDWVMEREVQPGTYALNDFNFEHPRQALQRALVVKSTVSRTHEKSDYEIYDYPGEFLEHGEGETLAKLRIEELQARHETLHGRVTALGMGAGHTFELKEHPRDDQNRNYLITSVRYEFDNGEFATSGPNSAASNVDCSIRALDASVPFRPARITPRPLIQGVQTAIVVGPDGEEIHTDAHARVKVQFHWDRYGAGDENSSCWIRVSQPWAGKGWGSMSIPRIGQEVIVEFLEGDPDRPIITGRVYNGEQGAPYAGSSGITSGLKSKTHKGSGYNEMSMDDTAGKEKITIHGQYDMNTTVEHDQADTVHNDRTITIDGKHTETIKKDTTIKVTEGKLVHRVEAGTADYYIKAAWTEKCDATQETTIKNNITIKSTAGEILVDAANKITLHTGDSKITMSKDGSISITGKKITIVGDETVKASGDKFEASGGSEAKLGTGSQNITTSTSKTAIAGAAINSSAVGMHEIAGAVVKIN
jgi:type VI secretion system secreted protein VgrG